MRDPAFNFYSDNFLSGTMFFTDEQVGKYIRLLCAQHQTGHLDEKHMIFICKGHDDDIWKKFVKDDNGLFYNERLEIEIEKRKKYSLSRSLNKKGKIKSKEDKSKSYDNHMGIGIGIGIEDINIDYINVFDVFRKIYPGTKRGNETEFENLKKKHKDWKQIVPILETTIVNQISSRNSKKSKGEFVPEWKNLQTWINQRCWEEVMEDLNVKSNNPKLLTKEDYFNLYNNG